MRPSPARYDPPYPSHVSMLLPPPGPAQLDSCVSCDSCGSALHVKLLTRRNVRLSGMDAHGDKRLSCKNTHKTVLSLSSEPGTVHIRCATVGLWLGASPPERNQRFAKRSKCCMAWREFNICAASEKFSSSVSSLKRVCVCSHSQQACYPRLHDQRTLLQQPPPTPSNRAICRPLP